MKKKFDSKNRWRNKVVAFRMSKEEAEQLNILSKLSGLTKQDYLIKRVLVKDIIINANPRVFKILCSQLQSISEEFHRLEKIGTDDIELLELIIYISEILNGLKGDIYSE